MNRTWSPRVLAVLVTIGLLSACSSASSNTESTTSTPVTPTVTSTLPDGLDLALTPVEGPYGVGHTQLTLVDDSRDALGEPTGDPDAEHRTLPVVLVYPTTAEDPADDTPRSIAPGVFPLVVFSHGIGADPQGYTRLVEPLVEAGHVVALPTFALTRDPGPVEPFSQGPAQAQDVSFLITRLLSVSAETNTLLEGHLTSEAVAVVGHSMGAATSLAFYDRCCVDPRVDAVVAVAGFAPDGADLVDAEGDPAAHMPVLLVHGTDDDVIPDSDGQAVFDSLDGVPRAMILLEGVDHVAVVDDSLTRTAVVDFLDLVLRDDPEPWQATVVDIEADRNARVELAGGLD